MTKEKKRKRFYVTEHVSPCNPINYLEILTVCLVDLLDLY